MTRLVAVTGLAREARILAGPGIVTVASGGVIANLSERIQSALTPDIAGIVSIGIAGALDPSLRVGDVVIDGDRIWRGLLSASLPEARCGQVVGSDQMVVDTAGKALLRSQTGALCVDMESHVAAAAAARNGLPFAALRVISDGADRALPKAAQAGMKPDGGMDIAAVLLSLASDPRQLPALIRTGMEAETAFKALATARRALGPSLGLTSA